MVSTSQPEAANANGPTHATETPVAQGELARHFVSFLVSFRSFRFLQQPGLREIWYGIPTLRVCVGSRDPCTPEMLRVFQYIDVLTCVTYN